MLEARQRGLCRCWQGEGMGGLAEELGGKVGLGFDDHAGALLGAG